MAIVQEHDLSVAHSQRLRSPQAAGNGLPERAIEELLGNQLIKEPRGWAGLQAPVGAGREARFKSWHHSQLEGVMNVRQVPVIDLPRSVLAGRPLKLLFAAAKLSDRRA